MTSINGISEVANPLLIFVPILLFLLSGYVIGRMISWIRKVKSANFRDLVYGNIVLCFLFATGFIFFGVLTYEAKAFFTFFTYSLIALAAAGIYFFFKSSLESKFFYQFTFHKGNIPTISAIIIFSILIGYISIVAYDHPIFSEYDAMYNFLPVSKSIILGNGLNHDYYTGSDILIRSPPFSQSINAWLIYSFGYSSLRLFPVYFILMSALMTYSLARTITKDSFRSLIAAIAFLIMPALFVVASRFSLQQDLSFVFFITTSFYFLLEIIRSEKISKTHLMMLSLSLALMPLTREIGLMVAWAILFIIPAVKFSQDSIKLKILFTILSLAPLYVLTLHDIGNNGITYTILFRLITLVAGNTVLSLVSRFIKDQHIFRELIPRKTIMLIPLLIPAVFVLSNFVIFDGPYPVLIFSNSFNQSLALYREVFGIPNKLYADLADAASSLPRLDVLFVSLALGSTFLFFKLRGFNEIVRKLKYNPDYAAIIVSLTLLLILWSYLLDSGFERSAARHVLYFAPMLTIVIILGMPRKDTSYQVYYLGVMIFSLYYFLFHNVHITQYDSHFGEFWIDPYHGPLSSLIDIAVAAALIAPLIVIEMREMQILKKLGALKSAPYTASILIVMIGIGGYVLLTSGITLTSLEVVDNKPPYTGWELNVFDVIKYLNSAGPGNVIGVRAPAIPFFTNRTDFDLYSVHAFNAMSQTLAINDSDAFREKLSDENIRYIVLPNKNSLISNTTQALENNFGIWKALAKDQHFDKIEFKQFDLYKYTPSYEMNLIGSNTTWNTVNNAKIYSNSDNFTITVKTNSADQLFNRGVLKTEIALDKQPLLLGVNYASQSVSGDAKFVLEIRNGTGDQILWSNTLENTDGMLATKAFILPSDLARIPVEFRVYVITDSPGEHSILLKKATITTT